MTPLVRPKPSRRRGRRRVTSPTHIYKRFAEQAEAAVASIRDPLLRQAAFERILERLLGDASSQGIAAGRNDSRRDSLRVPLNARTTTDSSAKPKSAPSPRTKPRRVQGKRHGGEGAIFLKWVAEGFFDKGRTFRDVLDHFHTEGRIIKTTSLPGYLLGGVRSGYLKRNKKNVSGKMQYVYVAAKRNNQ